MISFSGISIANVSEDKATSTAVLEIGPLPKGYGYTLGNSLRRVLLSSLVGAAITSVRINNLDHEFTTIPGIRQNILDIVLRLKNLRIQMNSEEPVILTLSKKGIGQVVASDFNASRDVEIINKEYLIADLTDASAQLTIEAVVERGTGYKRAEESLRDEIGRIPVDAIFSPVQLVDLKVLPSRKGARTDLDKIVLTVTTDGSITPTDAVKDALMILRDFFNEMAAVVSGTVAASEATSSPENMMSWKIADLQLSDEVKELLAGAKVSTLEELVGKSKTHYQKEVGLKAKQLKEIQAILDEYNLSLAKDEKKSKKTKS